MSDETLHNIEGLLVEIVKRLDLILAIHNPTGAAEKSNILLKKKILKKNIYTSEFEEFWRVYPRRTGHSNPKHPAQLKFAAAIKNGAKPDDIIAGAARYAAMVVDRDPQYIRMAETWLTNRMWEDGDGAETDEQRVERWREALRTGKEWRG